MAHSKKMFLLPQSAFSSMQLNQQYGPMHSTTQYLSSLDNDVKAVLNSSMPADEKAARYNEVLNRFASARISYAEPPIKIEVDQKAETQPTAGKTAGQLPQFADVAFARGMRGKQSGKHRALLKALQNNDKIKWNENAELLDDGQPIAGSNLADLVKYFSSTGFQPPVPGAQQFAKALRNANIQHVTTEDKYQHALGYSPAAPAPPAPPASAPSAFATPIFPNLHGLEEEAETPPFASAEQRPTPSTEDSRQATPQRTPQRTPQQALQAGPSAPHTGREQYHLRDRSKPRPQMHIKASALAPKKNSPHEQRKNATKGQKKQKTQGGQGLAKWVPY